MSDQLAGCHSVPITIGSSEESNTDRSCARLTS